MTTPLEERRRRLGLTQEELAKRAGVSKTTIVDLENGKTKHARQGTLNVIAKVLGVAADKLRPRATRGSEPAPLRRGDRGSLVQTATLGSEPRDSTPLQAGAQRDADSESMGAAPNHLLPNDLFPDHHAAWRDPDW